MIEQIDIAGYVFGTAPRSPVSWTEFEALKATAGWTEADEHALRRAAELIDQDAEALVQGLRAIIGSQPHLAHWFTHPDGSPNEEYKAAVGKRFVQWVHDTLTRPFDQAWLDYQEEIGLRHTPAKKNRTDSVDAPPVVPLRFLIAFLPPTLFAVPDLLQAKEITADELRSMSRAWTKAIALTLTLWSRPYVASNLW